MIKTVLWDVDGTLLDLNTAESVAIKTLKCREWIDESGICDIQMIPFQRNLPLAVRQIVVEMNGLLPVQNNDMALEDQNVVVYKNAVRSRVRATVGQIPVFLDPDDMKFAVFIFDSELDRDDPAITGKLADHVQIGSNIGHSWPPCGIHYRTCVRFVKKDIHFS